MTDESNKPPRPGWTFCRTIRVARGDEDGIEYLNVVGWTKGSFGIWEAAMKTALGTMPFTTITHLPTGKTLTIIPGLPYAAEVAEIAEMLVDWSAIAKDIPKDLKNRFLATMKAAGYTDYGLVADGQPVFVKELVGGSPG